MASRHSRRIEVPTGYTIVRDGGWCRVRRDADSALAGQRWACGGVLVRDWPHAQAAARWVEKLADGDVRATARLAWVAPGEELRSAYAFQP